MKRSIIVALLFLTVITPSFAELITVTPAASGSGSSGITANSTTCTSCTTNGLLYSDGTLVQSLATANSGVLVTSAGGVPSISSTLPSGLVIPGFAPLASPAFTGIATTPALNIIQGTITTNLTGLNITATWNAAGTTFDAPLKINVTNTASAASSLLADFQIGGVSQFKVDKSGIATAPSLVVSSGNLTVNSGSIQNVAWILPQVTAGAFDITPATGTTVNLRIGGVGNAVPSTTQLSFQSGAGTNIAGVNSNIIGSLSTGTGTDGDIIFKTGVKNGGSNATPAVATIALTVKGETQQVQAATTFSTNVYIVSTLPTPPAAGAFAAVSDAVACTFLASLTGGGSTYCPVSYNGSSWVGG